ncbi:glycosyltransferase family 4 protein [Paraburkholderia phenoliruptrix]|uniref:glycosyltransferase family 4 protein n=1 Tax=Paraburkholderia phenoliruptrix TaxID=252970 RepID=UPI0028699E11|nr:glycosyltransferase [Paraburkholderia phenoliruptrix]WMY07502.1 glycosyltransferase [Paraburkholderia phenoliruptrix]
MSSSRPKHVATRLMICAPDIFAGDAVGNHCLGLARVAQRLGYSVEMYAQHFDDATPTRPLSQLFERIVAEDLLVVSYSIVDPYLDRLRSLPCRKICYFHGVTTPDLLREFEPVTADLCAASILQFPDLKSFDLIVANSAFTASSLPREVKSSSLRVIPPVFGDMPVFRAPKIQRSVRRQTRNILTVGRVVPHKRIEDAIDIVAALRASGVDASLSVVGSATNLSYVEFLVARAAEVGLSAHFNLAGAVDNDTLVAYFHSASALISVSAHEGFCVPILEAMYMGVPSFARDGTAGAEVCVPVARLPLDNTAAAQNIWRFLTNSDMLDKLVSEGSTRADEILRSTGDEAWQAVFGTAIVQ